MKIYTRIVAKSAGVILFLLIGSGPAYAIPLYEYNFDAGSLANTGSAGDGTLTPFGPSANSGNTPAFVASRTDSNGVTRTDLYDYSVGGGTRSYHFSNIANQNLAAWTVALSARPNSTTSNQFSSVFMNDDFQINTTSGDWSYRGSNTPFGNVLADVWQYIVVTNDGTNTRLYLDGVLGPTLGDLGDQFNEIGIGTNRARDNPGRWNGDIDDVSVETFAFTQSQITALYQAGVAPPTITPEPSSFALTALSLLGLGAIRWRRRRR